MSVQNRVSKLEEKRREEEWLRVARRYREMTAEDVERLIKAHLFYRTWTHEQQVALVNTGALPDGIRPEDLPQ